MAVSKILGVCHHHVNKLCRQGKLKAEKIDGVWQVKSKDLDDYIRWRYRDDPVEVEIDMDYLKKILK